MPAQNAVTIIKSLVPNPNLIPFCSWCNLLLTVVAPFPRIQYSPISLLKFFLTPPSPPPSSSPLTCHEIYGTGNYNIISGSLKNSNFHKIFDPSKNMYKNIFSNLYLTVLLFFKLLFLCNIYKTL